MSSTENKKATKASANTNSNSSKAKASAAEQSTPENNTKYRKLPSTPEEIATRKAELADYDLLIQYRKSFGKWYIYFKGVKPELNVGLPFKSADKAFKYAMLLKNRYQAILPNNIYNELAEARKAELEAQPQQQAKEEEALATAPTE